jgi:N6-L-threonylcarbamoyladenine synthase
MTQKPEKPWILGIDTSNYTTSVAAVDHNGILLDHRRKLLQVELGERGLRQSDAVFAHLKAIDSIFESLQHPHHLPVAIGVSDRPRALSQSYMPVFLVGLQFAKVMSQMMHVPLFVYSHQEGHLEAGIYSALMPPVATFLAIHLSGGTTELLKVIKKQPGYEEEIIAETNDLSAGQLIDRIGVAMGLPFPAGPSLEKLALEAQNPVSIPSFFQAGKVSFSGAETKVLQLMQKAALKADLARGVENCIATTLEKMILWSVEKTEIRNVLLVGGVVANQYIRQRLSHRIKHSTLGASLYFASAELSSDNAVGIALLAATAARQQ